MTVRAVYENGVFRPVGPVRLPEGCVVEFEPRYVVAPEARRATLEQVYRILSHRFDSGEHDVAERHNEHQP